MNALIERARASLFLVPLVAVVFALVAGSVATSVDRSLDGGGTDLPLVFPSTVESARALLQTVAGATITFAGIAFSVSLLIFQQASNQYSPRVVHTLFRDPFNKRVMALVVGTFAYCIVVLRAVRTATEQGGAPVIPNLSIAIAVVLGIITILAVVAFIDHSAHAMDISNILDDVESESIARIRAEWPSTDPAPTTDEPVERPGTPAHIVTFDDSGWVRQLDIDQLAAATPDGGTMWVLTFPGRYAIRGTPICELSAAPADVDVTERAVRAGVALGETRTMQQDVSFGLRQLTDVTLKALSPSVNDPTTAQDAIFHTASVLGELLRRRPPAIAADRCRVVLTHEPTHEDLIGLAFDEVRRAAAPLPAVGIYLLEALVLLVDSTGDLSPGIRAALLRQARLVVEGCAASDNLPADVQEVERAFVQRFGPLTA